MNVPVVLPKVTKEFVLQKCTYFANVQLWPLKEAVDPERWLQNFETQEMEYAIHLLNQFNYFAEHLVDSIFAAAFQSLSRSFAVQGDPPRVSQEKWCSFVNSVIIVPVRGEKPSPTDSGYVFARKARQILGIREDQIVDPGVAAAMLRSDARRPVAFVDDFVGTGSQFCKTWERESFSAIARDSEAFFCYCPAFCTERGASVLRTYSPQVTLSPGHLISARYSTVAPDSLVWRPDQREEGMNFIRQASLRAGIPDTNGSHVNDWQGFERLGLAFAFHGSVPDATLPIFYWEQNGWRPLVRRT